MTTVLGLGCVLYLEYLFLFYFWTQGLPSEIPREGGGESQALLVPGVFPMLVVLRHTGFKTLHPHSDTKQQGLGCVPQCS